MYLYKEFVWFQVDINGWQMAIASFITKNESEKFIHQIETILHKYPDRMFENFKERNVQQIGEMIVGAINGVDSDLEYGNDEGYCDQVVIPTSDKYHRKLIEYKYLKKNDTDNELEKAITDARSQIDRYLSTRQIKRYLYDAWIMVFSKDTCIYKESIDII